MGIGRRQGAGRVLVALSGGVDSAVAALLLQQQGYEVVAAHMLLCAADDGAGAAAVAAELGLDFHCFDCRAEFDRQVVAPFCDAYQRGFTPNPCVDCNQHFKFGYLLEQLPRLGVDYLASGHYARIVNAAERKLLARGRDVRKDQSYFMFPLCGLDISRVLLPLGEMDKGQVQQLARQHHLTARHSDESQDICFIPANDYGAFLRQRLQAQPAGEIVHVDGRVLGRHSGCYRFTIGQRRGLGIAWHQPLYVVAIDSAAARVVVGEKEHLLRRQMTVGRVITALPWDKMPIRVDCRIRYRHQPAPARLEMLESERLVVEFEQPQSGITPGQAAVFYRDDMVVGGGWIE